MKSKEYTLIRKRKKRLKRIRISMLIPAFAVVFVLLGLVIHIYRPSNNVTVLYPTVLGVEDPIDESIFNKLLNTSTEKVVVNNLEDDFVKVTRHAGETKGTFSIYLKDFRSGKAYEYNTDKIIYAASLYKIPTIVAALKSIERGQLKFTDTIVYLKEDFEGGTGSLNGNSFGTYFNVEQLLTELIKNSDNVAQNILKRKIGYNAINEAYKTNSTDLSEAFIRDNKVSSGNFGVFLENILQKNYLSQESKKYLFDMMKDTSFDDRLSVYLNEGIYFSHKIGNWPATNSWHDCGVVFNDKYEGIFVLCVMTEDVKYEDFIDVNKRIAEVINKYVD